jgi:hypothetical protein
VDHLARVAWPLNEGCAAHHKASDASLF